LSNTPVKNIKTIKELPPELIKGRVIPVEGKSPITTDIFIIDCKNIISVIPDARR